MNRPAPRTAPRRTPLARAAFTLVEVLIVVVILAILAATVLPQFTNASGEAEASAIKQNLHVLRSQIELYRVQHNNLLPGADETEFVARMTGKTKRDGTVDATDGVYGPYVKLAFPTNPANGSNAVKGVDEFAAAVPTSGEGWVYNYVTGEIRATGSADYYAL